MHMTELQGRLIPQTGAAALWCLDPNPGHGSQDLAAETCTIHAWTCIWCSMSPPICGSCRPVTPPCPASGRIHSCACRERRHGQGDPLADLAS
jgi:hypothetical protein